jgi:hypothetical protein
MGQAGSTQRDSAALTTSNPTQAAPSTAVPTDNQVLGAQMAASQDKTTAIVILAAAAALFVMSRR